MEYGILTTRFTDETFLENIRWRQRNNDRSNPKLRAKGKGS